MLQVCIFSVFSDDQVGLMKPTNQQQMLCISDLSVRMMLGICLSDWPWILGSSGTNQAEPLLMFSASTCRSSCGGDASLKALDCQPVQMYIKDLHWQG